MNLGSEIMSANYKSVFDIIGPIMIGPSSSHTAGAVAIGQVVNKIFHAKPSKIVIHYYDSFAQTHKGHGTDYAIVGGILGFQTDDSRVPNSIQIARDQEIKVKFVEEKGDSPIGHPNTAVVDISNDDRNIEVSGCSIGGGTIEIRNIKMDGFEINPRGPLPIVFMVGDSSNDTKIKSRLSDMSTINSANSFEKGTDKKIFEYDLDSRLSDNDKSELSKDFKDLIYL